MIIIELAVITAQFDYEIYEVRFYATDLIVTCILYSKGIQPLVGDLVKLEYNPDLRREEKRGYKITDILYSKYISVDLNKIAIPLKWGLQAVRELHLRADALAIKMEFFFDVSPQLDSTLGLKTIQDLVNVDALTLVKAVSQFSYEDRTTFYVEFELFVQYFMESG